MFGKNASALNAVDGSYRLVESDWNFINVYVGNTSFKETCLLLFSLYITELMLFICLLAVLVYVYWQVLCWIWFLLFIWMYETWHENVISTFVFCYCAKSFLIWFQNILGYFLHAFLNQFVMPSTIWTAKNFNPAFCIRHKFLGNARKKW